MSELENLYSTREYCVEELARIREMWGSKSTFTQSAIDGARTSLGFMTLYCPETLRDVVAATLDELGRRELYSYSVSSLKDGK
jgi:hypothetical protein